MADVKYITIKSKCKEYNMIWQNKKYSHIEHMWQQFQSKIIPSSLSIQPTKPPNSNSMKVERQFGSILKFALKSCTRSYF